MTIERLILKRASASRLSGEWNDDDYDVLADGVVVGRIFSANAAPVGASWMWTLAFGHHGDRTRQVLFSITKHEMRRSADEIGATSISFRPKVLSDPASVVDRIFSAHTVCTTRKQPRSRLLRTGTCSPGDVRVPTAGVPKPA
jgi:hypothetical protein